MGMAGRFEGVSPYPSQALTPGVVAFDLVYNPYAGMDVETSVHAYILALTYQTVF